MCSVRSSAARDVVSVCRMVYLTGAHRDRVHRARFALAVAGANNGSGYYDGSEYV